MAEESKSLIAASSVTDSRPIFELDTASYLKNQELKLV